jgi:hypothetical protein
MALTLIATSGASNANSFATVAEADSYHEAHLYGSAWTSAATAKKEQSLVMATRWLDAQVRWLGYASYSTQVLGWPRYGVSNPVTGVLLDSTTIPQRIRDVTAELARRLIVGDLTADNDAEVAGLKRLKAGPVELEFSEYVKSKPLPDAVLAMLNGFVTTIGSRSINVPLVRV